MTREDSMDATLSNSDKTIKSKSVCPYYKVGYCKYKQKCKNLHPKADCEEKKCVLKTCMKRHRKACRYGHSCNRKESCEFIHAEKQIFLRESNNSRNQSDAIKELIQTKDAQIEELTSKINTIEMYVSALAKVQETKLKEIENKFLEPVVKCNQCHLLQEKVLNLEMHMENLLESPKQNEKEIIYQFKCDKCDFKTDENICMNEHKREKHRIFECDLCDFDSSSSNGLKIHKGKMHSRSIVTQTEKIKPHTHTLKVYAPMRSRWASHSREWYKEKMNHMEEIVSVEDVWLRHTTECEGEFVMTDLIFVTEEPWTSKWLCNDFRKEMLNKIQVKETTDKPDKISNMEEFNNINI